MSRAMMLNRVRSDLKKVGGDQYYLGTFDSLADLKKAYPEKSDKPNKIKNNDELLGDKVCDKNSWAIVENDKELTQYKYTDKNKWKVMSNSGGGVSQDYVDTEVAKKPSVNDSETPSLNTTWSSQHSTEIFNTTITEFNKELENLKDSQGAILKTEVTLTSSTQDTNGHYITFISESGDPYYSEEVNKFRIEGESSFDFTIKLQPDLYGHMAIVNNDGLLFKSVPFITQSGRNDYAFFCDYNTKTWEFDGISDQGTLSAIKASGGGGISNHEDLEGLMGGNPQEHWHLLKSQVDLINANKGYFESEEELNKRCPASSPYLTGGEFAFVDDSDVGLYMFVFTPIRKVWVRDASVNWISKAELETGIMLKSYGTLTEVQGDLRFKKNGHKIDVQLFDSGQWSNVTTIGSLLTDCYYLKSDDFGSMVGINDIDDDKYYNIFRRYIYTNTDTKLVEIGNEFGSLERTMCLSVKSKDGLFIAYPTEKLVLEVQDDFSESFGVGTYETAYTCTSDIEFLQAEFQVEQTAKARMWIVDAETNETVYESQTRRDAIDSEGSLIIDDISKVTTGKILATFPRIGFMSEGRTYKIYMQIFSGMIKGKNNFIRFAVHGNSWKEDVVATKDYTRNIILNKNDNIHLTSNLSYGAISYQLNLLQFTLPEGMREPSVYEERGDQLLYFYGDYTIPKDKKISMKIREIKPLHKKSRITLFFELYQQNGYFETVKMEKSLIDVISEKGLNLRTEVAITKHSEGHIELYCAFDFEVGDSIILDFLEGTQFSNSRAYFRLREETLETLAECVDEMFSEYGTFKENLMPDNLATMEDMRSLYERVRTVDLSNGDSTIIRVGYSSSDFVRLAKCSLAPNTVEYEVGNAKYTTPISENYKGVYSTKYGANSNIDSDYILTRINNLGQADVYEFDKAVQFDYHLEWEGPPPTIVLDTINLLDINGKILKQNKDLYVEGSIAVIRFVVYELTYNFGLQVGVGNDLSNCNATANWVMKNMEFSETPLFDQNNTIDPIFNNGRMREAILYRSKDTKAPAINYESPLFGKSPVISMSDGSGYGINIGSFMSDITFNTNSTNGLSVSALEEMIQFPIETAVNDTNMAGTYTKQFTLTGIDKKNVVLGLVFATFYDSKVEVSIRDGSTKEIFRKQFQLFSQGDNSAYAIFSQSTMDKFMMGNGTYTLEVKVLEGYLIGGDFPRAILVHGASHSELLAYKSSVDNLKLKTDLIDITGDGSQFLSNDGKYKTVSGWDKKLLLNKKENISIVYDDITSGEVKVDVDLTKVIFASTNESIIKIPQIKMIDDVNKIVFTECNITDGDYLNISCPNLKEKIPIKVKWIIDEVAETPITINKDNITIRGDGADVMTTMKISKVGLQTTIEMDMTLPFTDLIIRLLGGNNLSFASSTLSYSYSGESIVEKTENLFVDNKLNKVLGAGFDRLNLAKKENVEVTFKEDNTDGIIEYMTFEEGQFKVDSPSGNIIEPTYRTTNNISEIVFTKCDVIEEESFQLVYDKCKALTMTQVKISFKGDGLIPIKINPLNITLRGLSYDVPYTYKIITNSEFDKVLVMNMQLPNDRFRIMFRNGNDFTNTVCSISYQSDYTESVEKTENLFIGNKINPTFGGWNPKLVDLTVKDNIDVKIPLEEIVFNSNLDEIELFPNIISSSTDSDEATFINYGEECLFDTEDKSLEIVMPIPKEFIGKVFNTEIFINTIDDLVNIISLDDFSLVPEQVVTKSIRAENNTKGVTLSGIKTDETYIRVLINSKATSTIKTNLSNCKTYIITFKNGITSKTIPLFDNKSKLNYELDYGWDKKLNLVNENIEISHMVEEVLTPNNLFDGENKIDTMFLPPFTTKKYVDDADKLLGSRIDYIGLKANKIVTDGEGNKCLFDNGVYKVVPDWDGIVEVSAPKSENIQTWVASTDPTTLFSFNFVRTKPWAIAYVEIGRFTTYNLTDKVTHLTFKGELPNTGDSTAIVRYDFMIVRGAKTYTLSACQASTNSSTDIIIPISKSGIDYIQNGDVFYMQCFCGNAGGGQLPNPLPNDKYFIKFLKYNQTVRKLFDTNGMVDRNILPTMPITGTVMISDKLRIRADGLAFVFESNPTSTGWVEVGRMN